MNTASRRLIHRVRKARQGLGALAVCATLLACHAGLAKGDNTPRPEECAASRRFASSRFTAADAATPFSFRYGGKENAWESWHRTSSRRELDKARDEQTIVWRDQATGLEVRCVAITYKDFPVVEWTISLEHTGTENTPLIENLLGLDTLFEAAVPGPCALHGIKGDFCTADSYEPFRLELASGTTKEFAPPGTGKSSDGADGWPYHNLQFGGGGAIIAIGWPGQWASRFTCQDDGVRAQAGQQLTLLEQHEIRLACAEAHLPLRPLGESEFTEMIAEARKVTMGFIHPSLEQWLPDMTANYRILIPGLA